MSNQYLAEAFQKLSLLENDFYIDDKKEVDELRNFMADDIEAPEEFEIYDLGANRKTDLEDNYLGKVVVECPACLSKYYKDPSEIVIEDGEDLCNADEECMNCFHKGFNIIGKVCNFKDDAFDHEVDNDKLDVEGEEVVDGEEEIKDDDFKEALEEALAELDEGCKKDEACEDCKDCDEACEEELDEAKKCGGYDCQRDKDIDDALDKLDDEEAKELDKHSAKAEALDEEDEKFPNPDKHEEVGEHNGVKMYKCNDCGKFAAMVDGKKVKKDSKEDLEAAIDAKDESLVEETAETPIVEEVVDEAKECCTDQAEEDKEKLEKTNLEESNENLGVRDDVACDDSKSLEGDQEELVHDGKENVKPITEAIEEVEVKTEDGEVEVEKDGNKVTVEFKDEEPEEELPAEENKEEILPLGDEDIDQLGKDPGEELPLEDEAPVEDEFDVDEFDDEEFSGMGESYLRRVYENVNTYKVTSASQNENKQLVVEGLITFDSGKQKKTTFVFENKKVTKRGKHILEGKNEMVSKSDKAFLLKGMLEDHKFTCEALTYNYTAPTLNEGAENKTVRVYGRVAK